MSKKDYNSSDPRPRERAIDLAIDKVKATFTDFFRWDGPMLISISEKNQRCGEDHHNSKLSNHEVEMVRWLHDCGMGYARIADKFEVSKSCIAMICRYERRTAYAVRFKRVEDE